MEQKEPSFWRRIWCRFFHLSNGRMLVGLPEVKFKPIRSHSSLHECQVCGEQWIL